MKQITLYIPDNQYHALIQYIKNKFTNVRITEEKSKPIEEVAEEDSVYETLLLSEKTLAEDWLSEEDNRWDEVL